MKTGRRRLPTIKTRLLPTTSVAAPAIRREASHVRPLNESGQYCNPAGIDKSSAIRGIEIVIRPVDTLAK